MERRTVGDRIFCLHRGNIDISLPQERVDISLPPQGQVELQSVVNEGQVELQSVVNENIVVEESEYEIPV